MSTGCVNSNGSVWRSAQAGVIWLAALIAFSLAACLPADLPVAAPPDPTLDEFRGPLIVSAASDLIPAFEAIGRAFRAETGIDVTFNFGSSGLLAQQIEQGAPVDVYASASQLYIDELLAGGHVLEDTIALYGIGRLTLWTRADSPLNIASLDDLTDPAITRIAIANPDHAPYGVAAREALQSAGLWETLHPKLILGENIAATLQYVETGNVEVGIIALSLSIAAGEVGRWTLIPPELHSPINQALAVVAHTSHAPQARRFAAYLNQESSRQIMREFGFVLPDELSDDSAGEASESQLQADDNGARQSP